MIGFKRFNRPWYVKTWAYQLCRELTTWSWHYHLTDRPVILTLRVDSHIGFPVLRGIGSTPHSGLNIGMLWNCAFIWPCLFVIPAVSATQVYLGLAAIADQ